MTDQPLVGPRIEELGAADDRLVKTFIQEVPRGEYSFLKEDLGDPAVMGTWRSHRGAQVFLAYLDEELVGLLAVIPGLGWSRHVGEFRMVVHPAKRGRGVGAALARRGLMAAVEAGLEKVSVEVLAEQEAVAALFQQLGFTPEALLTDQVRDDGGAARPPGPVASGPADVVHPRDHRRGRERSRGVRVVHKARNSLPLFRANTAIVERPDRLMRAMVAALPYGTGLLAGVAASVARYPHAPVLVTADEQVTYRELWRGSTVLAGALADRGLTSESRVGVLCRNSPWFVHSLLGAALIGADVVLLNTSFGPAQLRDTIEAEGIDLLLHDDEFAQAVGRTSALSVTELRDIVGNDTGGTSLPRPKHQSSLVVLTSGTTGRPKGARRASDGPATEGVGALLGSIPLRARDTIVVPAPFFHAWGLAGLLVGMGLAATVVTAPHFEPADVLDLVETHGADALFVVPTMLQRMCTLPPRTLARFDTGSLRAIASSGSAIQGPLVLEVLDRFGPILYNVYGSTEVAAATVAKPRDLRTAPTTAGRPATGVRVAVLDDAGSPTGAGVTGRVFVGNAARFDGYTSGGAKESVNGLMSTGDLGHFDARGLLFIDGREDDMIVSGGENVYPSEVEHLLNEHPDIEEAVVVGIDDEAFGRALKAVVVLRSGHSLDAEALKTYVTEHLARFEVPRAIVFLDELPRNATGKVLRRHLT